MDPVQKNTSHEVILEAMRAWLNEQAQAARYGTPWVDVDEMNDAALDGDFDLENLASRIESALGAAGRLRVDALKKPRQAP